MICKIVAHLFSITNGRESNYELGTSLNINKVIKCDVKIIESNFYEEFKQNEMEQIKQ